MFFLEKKGGASLMILISSKVYMLNFYIKIIYDAKIIYNYSVDSLNPST